MVIAECGFWIGDGNVANGQRVFLDAVASGSLDLAFIAFACGLGDPRRVRLPLVYHEIDEGHREWAYDE